MIHFCSFSALWWYKNYWTHVDFLIKIIVNCLFLLGYPTVIKCVQQILCLCIVLFGEKYITHNLLPSAVTGIHPLTPTEDGSLQCFCLRSEVNTGLGDLLKDVSCGYMRESRNPRFSYLFPLVFLLLGLWSWHGEEKKWKL